MNHPKSINMVELHLRLASALTAKEEQRRVEKPTTRMLLKEHKKLYQANEDFLRFEAPLMRYQEAENDFLEKVFTLGVVA